MTAPAPGPSAAQAVPIFPLDAGTLADWLMQQTAANRRWLESSGFRAERGERCLIPGPDGAPAGVALGVEGDELYALAALPLTLPPGDYALAKGPVALDPERAALGFALGAYQYSRYRKPKREPARLQLPAGVERRRFESLLAACYRVRDLVNTPSEDCGPEQLAAAVRTLAERHGARVREWIGEDLLRENFPAIHAVGRGSVRAPRLIELTWGNEERPRLTLVGKGVCFDTGGLDLKPADGMRAMKKDMGGAAHALALAGLVMDAALPVRLTLLVPAVENAIGPNSYRPGDVIATRAGLSVEIHNTDAEGRVILGDALSFAAEQQPDLLLDFATLTGAARVALGPDLPALFSNRDALRDELLASARQQQDPMWPLPLWQGYANYLESAVADLGNAGTSRHAGAIVAGLYLSRFVPERTPWLHLDLYAWNETDRPGRPKGGEAQGLRAAFAFLSARYGGAAKT
jgi:leucyl aminopeptidase